jgi:hypothetical protein
VKETNMKKNRFFNLIVIVSLAVMAVLTISQMTAANRLVSAASNDRAESSEPVAEEPCAASTTALPFIHMVYVERTGTWVPYTQDGPAGVDGGLIQLLNDRRTCSQ